MNPESSAVALTGFTPIVQVSLVPTTGEATLTGLVLIVSAALIRWVKSKVRHIARSWSACVNVILFDPGTGNVGLNGIAPPRVL